MSQTPHTRGRSISETPLTRGRSMSPIWNNSFLLRLHARMIHKSNPEQLLVLRLNELGPQVRSTSRVHESCRQVVSTSHVHESGPWVMSTSQVLEEEKYAWRGHIHGRDDSMTDPAQRTESVPKNYILKDNKIPLLVQATVTKVTFYTLNYFERLITPIYKGKNNVGW